MRIRPARGDDFEAIAVITNHYIESTAIHFGYEPVAPAELRGLWETHGERYPWLVAEDARVIGYAKASVWRERPAYHWTCEVGLYLAYDQRGQGFGTELYKALLDECAARGFRTAVAGIALPNPASLALHEKLGFETAGVVRDAGWKMGKWHDVAFFQKRFSTGPDAPRGG